jgi:hypothetical protein
MPWILEDDPNASQDYTPPSSGGQWILEDDPNFVSQRSDKPIDYNNELDSVIMGIPRGAAKLGGFVYDTAKKIPQTFIATSPTLRSIADYFGADPMRGADYETSATDKMLNTLSEEHLNPMPRTAVGKLANSGLEFATQATLMGGGSLPIDFASGVAAEGANQAGYGPVGQLVAASAVPVGSGLTKALMNPARKAVGDLAPNYLKESLGANRKALANADINYKPVTYVDELGQPATRGQASDYITSYDKSAERIAQDGFTPSNDPIANKVNINNRIQTLQDTRNGLLDQADQFVAQSGQKVSFKPDVSEAQSFIDDLRATGGSSATQAERFQRELDDRLAAWNSKPRTLADFEKFKTAIADSTKAFEKTSDDYAVRFNRKLYQGWQKGLERNFDGVMQQADPAMVGQLKELNTTLSAYHNFEKPVNLSQNRGMLDRFVSQPVQKIAAASLFSKPLTAAASLSDALPASMYKLTKAAGDKVVPYSQIAGEAGRSELVAALGTALSNRQRQERSEPTTPRLSTPPPAAAKSPQPDPYQLADALNFAINSKRLKNEAGGANPMLPDMPDVDPKAAAWVEQILPQIQALETGKRKNPENAISEKGAKGVFQVMDATGREYHRRLGMSEPYDPRNREQQKQIAAAYLLDLKAKYQDDRLVFAGYNMGEKKLDALRRKYGNSWDDIAPHLGKGNFEESKNYVTNFLKALA